MEKRYAYKDGEKWRIRIGDNEYCGPWVDLFAAFEELNLNPAEVQRAYDICVENMQIFEQYKADSQTLKKYHNRLIPVPPTKDSLADRGCPNCNAYINWDGLNTPVKDAPRFCRHCGQKFRWDQEKGYDPLDFLLE